MKFACLVITRWNTTPRFMTVHYDGVYAVKRSGNKHFHVDKEMYKKVCCMLGSVVKLDRTTVHTYNGDFGVIHIGYVLILFRIAFRVGT